MLEGQVVPKSLEARGVAPTGAWMQAASLTSAAVDLRGMRFAMQAQGLKALWLHKRVGSSRTGHSGLWGSRK